MNNQIENKNTKQNNETNIKVSILKKIKNELLTLLLILVLGAILGCPTNRLFGIPCPGCGLTRAGLCLLCGNLEQSFYYHPMFIPVVFVAIAFVFREWIPSWVKNIGGSLFFIIFVSVYFYRMFVTKSEVVQIHLDEGWVYIITSYIRKLIL